MKNNILFLNPSDNVFLMGTHNGLFKSTDAGNTFDLNNPKVLYAAESNSTLYKSKDRGSSWKKI